MELYEQFPPNPLTLIFTSGSQNTSLQRGRKDELAHQVLPKLSPASTMSELYPAGATASSSPLSGVLMAPPQQELDQLKGMFSLLLLLGHSLFKNKETYPHKFVVITLMSFFWFLEKAHLQWGHPQTEIRVICLAGFPGGIHNKKDTASVLKISVYIHHASSFDFKL